METEFNRFRSAWWIVKRWPKGCLGGRNTHMMRLSMESFQINRRFVLNDQVYILIQKRFRYIKGITIVKEFSDSIKGLCRSAVASRFSESWDARIFYCSTFSERSKWPVAKAIEGNASQLTSKPSNRNLARLSSRLRSLATHVFETLIVTTGWHNGS